MANLKTLQPNIFPKGVSGNPNGRPKGAKNRSTIVKKWLELEAKLKNPITNKSEAMTVEDAMTLSMIKKTLDGGEGSVSAYNALNDNAYGKLTDKLEVKPDPSQLTDEELARELYKRLVSNLNYSPVDALAGVKSRFPGITIDVEIEGNI